MLTPKGPSLRRSQTTALFPGSGSAARHRARIRRSLRDANGKYLQTFKFQGNGLATSESSPNALRPRSSGCERTVDEKLYCTIQDGRGTILQGCIYDGKSLGCGTEHLIFGLAPT